MARSARTPKRRRPIRERWLAAVWGLLACVSVSVVVYSASGERGRARLAELFEASGEEAERAASRDDIEQLTTEVVRMRAEMRRLSLEKEALAIKLAALEGQLGPATGSLGASPGDRIPLSAHAASAAGAAEIAADTESVEVGYEPMPLDAPPDGPRPEEADVHAMLRQFADPAAQRMQSTVTRTRFAIELAVADTMNSARLRWLELSGAHSDLIGNLEPSVAIMEADGGVRLRLLAGPFANVADAVEVCTLLVAREIDCAAVPGEGQALVMR